MKTIKQIADELGVSKQTVSYHLRKLGATKENGLLAVKENGSLAVSLAAENLVKSALSEKITKSIPPKESPKESPTIQSTLRFLEQEIEFLREQLKAKDEQLSAAQESLKAAQLLGMKPRQVKLLRAEHDGGDSTDTAPMGGGIFSRLFAGHRR